MSHTLCDTKLSPVSIVSTIDKIESVFFLATIVLKQLKQKYCSSEISENTIRIENEKQDHGSKSHWHKMTL